MAMNAALYTYFRSSAAYRARIALALKGVAYTPEFVDLLKGEQTEAPFKSVNPAGLVPFWQEDAFRLSQSLAIIEYLDEVRPEPPLLPGDAKARAQIRAFSLMIACDIHPLNNRRVLNRLKQHLGADDLAVSTWIAEWISRGFAALETMLGGSSHKDRFCFGETPTLADVCLVPQVYNARRYNVDLAAYPTLTRIDETCRAEPAFRAAAPERQGDFE
jgi:maleylpyruvate isomerase